MQTAVGELGLLMLQSTPKKLLLIWFVIIELFQVLIKYLNIRLINAHPRKGYNSQECTEWLLVALVMILL